MDLYGKDKGNISLPKRLQPPDFDETKLEDFIVNTQKCFYNIKIEEIKRRIQRLEDRNVELESNLENTNYSIKVLQEERATEIQNLEVQVGAQASRIDDYRKQLMAVASSRVDDKIAHTAKVKDINDKYNNTRLVIASQIKLISAKTNVLQDYKLIQDALREKLEMQNQNLIDESEQVEENIASINRKFRIDIERLKGDLYNHLLDLSAVFQVEVARHMPYPISRLLSENIATNNNLLLIKQSMAQYQDYGLSKKAIKAYETKSKNTQLQIKRSIMVTKLEKSAIGILHKSRSKPKVDRAIANILSEFDKLDYITEDQYVVNKDHALLQMQKSDMTVKMLEIELYGENEKLYLINDQNKQLREQLTKYLQMIYDIELLLTKLNSECND